MAACTCANGLPLTCTGRLSIDRKKKLKKLYAAVLLVFASSGSFAEWSEWVRLESSTKYVDQSTIKHDGTTVSYWELTDYKAPRGSVQARSLKSLVKIFCDKDEYAIALMIAYSESMGKGKELLSSKSDEREPIVPGGIMANGPAKLCKR